MTQDAMKKQRDVRTEEGFKGLFETANITSLIQDKV